METTNQPIVSFVGEIVVERLLQLGRDWPFRCGRGQNFSDFSYECFVATHPHPFCTDLRFICVENAIRRFIQMTDDRTLVRFQKTRPALTAQELARCGLIRIHEGGNVEAGR